MSDAAAVPTAITPAASDAALANILAHVSREALQGDNPHDVLRRIVDVLVDALPVAIASIILLNEAGDAFVQEVDAGTFDLGQPTDWPWPVSIGAAGRCARLGVSQLIDDVAADPDYLPGNRAVQSEYLVPIRHRDRLHGVLNIESAQLGFFDDGMRLIFDAVADQIAGAIHLARLAAELEAANGRLQQMSMVDGLTGISNRRAFDSALDAMCRRMGTSLRPLALLLVDADHFKMLNDALGHLRGDDCLTRIAVVCATSAASADGKAARFGGEEFALLLPDHDADAAQGFADALRLHIKALALPHPASPVAPVVTVSLGVAVLTPGDPRNARALLGAADRALYAAKAAGRDCVVVDNARGA